MGIAPTLQAVVASSGLCCSAVETGHPSTPLWQCATSARPPHRWPGTSYTGLPRFNFFQEGSSLGKLNTSVASSLASSLASIASYLGLYSLCSVHRPLGLCFSILWALEFNTLYPAPASGPLFFNPLIPPTGLEFNTLASPPASGALLFNPLIPPTGLEFNTLASPPASGALFFNSLGSGNQSSGLSTGLWASVFQFSGLWKSILFPAHGTLGLCFSILWALEFNTLAYPPASGALLFNPLGSGIQYSVPCTGL